MTKFEAQRKRWKSPRPCSPKELLRRKFDRKVAELKRQGDAEAEQREEATEEGGADAAGR